MNREILSALQPVAERLKVVLADKPELAGWLRDLASVLIALTDPPAAPAPAAPYTRPPAAVIPLPTPLPPSLVPVAPNTVTVAVAAPEVEAPQTPSPTVFAPERRRNPPTSAAGTGRSTTTSCR